MDLGATMTPHENRGDVADAINHFLAQYRALSRATLDDPNDAWLTHPAFHGPGETPLSQPHRPASSGKTTSHYSIASTSTEQTCVTSVFSTPAEPTPAPGPTIHTAWAPAPTDDHPDRRELSDQELLQLHATPDPAQLASRRIPCEFTRYTGCSATFDAFTQYEAWIRHELEGHLGWDPPATCLCWFCDDYKFVTGRTGHGDDKENFRSRMMHIAGHFQWETVDARGIRPDFFFLDHIWKKGSVSREVFERERGLHEAVQVDGLRPRGYKTRKMEREEERRVSFVVDTRREERERKKEVRRARDKG